MVVEPILDVASVWTEDEHTHVVNQLAILQRPSSSWYLLALVVVSNRCVAVEICKFENTQKITKFRTQKVHKKVAGKCF
eukprot:3096418-Amphidinium_carterae.1